MRHLASEQIVDVGVARRWAPQPPQGFGLGGEGAYGGDEYAHAVWGTAQPYDYAAPARAAAVSPSSTVYHPMSLPGRPYAGGPSRPPDRRQYPAPYAGGPMTPPDVNTLKRLTAMHAIAHPDRVFGRL